MRITLDIPDDLAAALASPGGDPARSALEAVGIEAYRRGKFSAYQLRMFLGIPSRFALEEFLKQHEVYDYGLEDFEKDLEAARKLRARRRSEKPQ